MRFGVTCPNGSGRGRPSGKRHHQFAVDGTWDKVLAKVLTDADAAGELDWAISVDSTIARVHQHGATAARTTPELCASSCASQGGHSPYFTL